LQRGNKHHLIARSGVSKSGEVAGEKGRDFSRVVASWLGKKILHQRLQFRNGASSRGLYAPKTQGRRTLPKGEGRKRRSDKYEGWHEGNTVAMMRHSAIYHTLNTVVEEKCIEEEHANWGAREKKRGGRSSRERGLGHRHCSERQIAEITL